MDSAAVVKKRGPFERLFSKQVLPLPLMLSGDSRIHNGGR